MQESKKVIVVFISIIVILLMIVFAMIFKKEKQDRVLNIYNEILTNQKFTFSMDEIDSEYKYKISIAHKDNNINIDMNVNDERTSTLILDGQAYFIMHNLKEYYYYESDELDGDIIISGLNEASEKEYIIGEEELKGQKYYYEEYDGISNFLILLDEEENATIKTRFYFDGNDIVYIKNIMYSNDGTIEEELLKITLEYNVDDSLFEIPQDYAEA